MKIEGFFRSIKDANKAVKKLKSSGLKAFADLNDHYVFNRNTQTNLPGTSTSTSLSELVLESGEPVMDRSVTPLSAANPSVSGLAGFEEITDFNSKVVVDVEDNNIGKAKEIIEDMGGTLNNPNMKFPKGLENINIDDFGIDDEDLY